MIQHLGGTAFFPESVHSFRKVGSILPTFDYFIFPPSNGIILLEKYEETIGIASEYGNPVTTTTLWVNECKKYNKILDTDTWFIFKPLPLHVKDYREMLGSLSIAISGFGPEETWALNQLAIILGAEVDGNSIVEGYGTTFFDIDIYALGKRLTWYALSQAEESTSDLSRLAYRQ